MEDEFVGVIFMFFASLLCVEEVGKCTTYSYVEAIRNRSLRDTGKLKIFRKQAESVIFHRSLILGKKN